MHMRDSKVIWQVNENQKVLDEFYVRMLGHEGDKLLAEELKWLAVTHKSFDQGRRGFNDRLAFLGTSRGLGTVSSTMMILLTELMQGNGLFTCKPR